MRSEQEQMLDSPDAIRAQIEQTKSRLFERLAQIEIELKGEVDDAKGFVQKTIADVRESLNVRHQIESHPLPFVGGSVAIGFALGRAIFNSAREHLQESEERLHAGSRMAEQIDRKKFRSSALKSSGGAHSVFKKLNENFGDEIQQAKRLAVGAIIGAVGNVAKNSMSPTLSKKVGEVIERLAMRL